MKETHSRRKKIKRKGEAKEDKHIKRPKKSFLKAKFKRINIYLMASSFLCSD